MNVVCVVNGVVAVDVEVWGRGCMPRDCAADVCVRKAKGAVASLLLSVIFEGEVELRCSRLVAGFGCSRARNLAICASLRFFSATRAALSFSVSRSLRRRV